ncbi:ATPase [Actinomycetota bacterium]|nr:ATPase [Actinomycetota bacterium]
MKKRHIKREQYLKSIRGFNDNTELIKIISGVRRSGKSVFMSQIIDELIEKGVCKSNIIRYDFEKYKYIDLLDPKKLHQAIVNQVSGEGIFYIFFDEIQMVDDFENVINSLRNSYNVSIFITGSNSKMLASELSTVLSGRYVKFEIQPLSFGEACKLMEIKKADRDEFLLEYLEWGGMPGRFVFSDENERYNYLNDVFDSIVERDVIERSGIKEIDLFRRVFQYLVENNSQLFSANSVYNSIVSSGRKVSKTTIYAYLEAITAALLMKRVGRYDITGKAMLATIDKYYSVDLGISQIKVSNSTLNRGAQLENLVYNELIRRGYEVNVGYLSSGEIDFVATKRKTVEYYQVAYILTDEKTVEREFGAFKKIADNFPKYVLSMDKIDFSQNGIVHKNIEDWLMEEFTDTKRKENKK